MGQILKLYDYISRYEMNTNQYTNQFIRLKKERWESLQKACENGFFTEEKDESEKTTKGNIFSFKRGKKRSAAETDKKYEWFYKEFSEGTGLNVDLLTSDRKRAEAFKEYIYRFQLKWASSTISQISSIQHEVYLDKELEMLAQSLPDSYFILYKPVLKVRKAAVELTVVLLAPLKIYCVVFLEGRNERESVFLGSKNRFWEERFQNGTRNVLNPCASLFRTEKVLANILNEKAIDLPIEKLIISRTSYIDYPDLPFGLSIVDKRNWREWLTKQQKNTAPIKSKQISAARQLLYHGESRSHDRKEWLDS
ncbi:NERD domain-containing protein [Bacillus gobiensis]|uniref:NERD domain-containing protein n=1 Tax=Bacillus gobiensis TaxID=1441095 RepID=A0A0M5JE85_9BACI|nr:NERD domain-containing protein [Bacillus gobiensis]ALC82057.1 hypothetical protein AM592_10905 [Bacillus gobiensis]